MEGMFLSIVVPVYNAASYLPQCLDSLLYQDIPHTDYEILCVNDGSTDGSREILDAYGAKYPSLRAIHKENGGVVTARNLGLSQAQGQYIWFVDADDLIQENILGALRTLAERTQCDRIVLGGYTFTDELTPEAQAAARQGVLPCNTPWEDSVVWRSLLSRTFLSSHNLFFRYPELTHGEDGLYMYEVTSAHPKTEEIPDILYFYRTHSSSVDTSNTPECHRKKLHSYLRITQILHDYYLSGRKNPETANKLMTFLWFTLFETASLPREQAAEPLNQLKALGLYPSRRLPECTLDHAYITRQEGLAGKVLDKISMNLQTSWGYAAMRWAIKARALLR